MSPFVIVQSGAPFDITAGNDLYGTTQFNGRPGVATDPNTPGLIATPYGLLDPNPRAGEALLSRNYGRGPSLITMNLRVAKSIGFGGEPRGASGAGFAHAAIINRLASAERAMAIVPTRAESPILRSTVDRPPFGLNRVEANDSRSVDERLSVYPFAARRKRKRK